MKSWRLVTQNPGSCVWQTDYSDTWLSACRCKRTCSYLSLDGVSMMCISCSPPTLHRSLEKFPILHSLRLSIEVVLSLSSLPSVRLTSLSLSCKSPLFGSPVLVRGFFSFIFTLWPAFSTYYIWFSPHNHIFVIIISHQLTFKYQNRNFTQETGITGRMGDH